MTNKALRGATRNRLVAGPGGSTRNQELRFTTSAKDFKPIIGDISEAEILDTRKLIEELRRRCNVFSGITDFDHRVEVWQKLAPEVNELYLSLIALGSIDPSEAITELLNNRKLKNTMGNNHDSSK